MPVMHQGYIPTPPGQMRLLEKLIPISMEFCDFGLAESDEKLVLPYKSVQKSFAKAFEDDAQTTGDCTSHGTRNANDISRAVEFDIKGELEVWEARGATEPGYGYRGYGGQGMNPGKCTEFYIKYGMLVRKDYPGVINLTKYNSKVGTTWGSKGIPKAVLELAKLHPSRYFARIRNLTELKAAIANGYGVHGGCNYGNSGVRDKRGIARWDASWNHDMAVGGYWIDDDLYFLILNSWGIWNRGGHPPWGPIPGGSFLVPSRDMDRMVRTGEYWAVGNVDGFKPQTLPNYGTGSFL